MSRRSYSPPPPSNRRRHPRCDTTKPSTTATTTTSRSRNSNRHADCSGETCKAVEKKYGGFGWEEGIALALMGAMALFNVDKALEKDVEGERRSLPSSSSSSSSSTTTRESRDKRRSRTGHADRDRYGSSQRGRRDRSREPGGSDSRRSGRRGATW